MISFIIYEKDIFYLEKCKMIIDKIMINSNIDYRIKLYKNEMAKEIDDSFKIFIIADIENKTIDKIKQIRIKNDDWQSMIIIIAEREKNRYKYFENNYLLLDYINKNDNFDNRLREDILISLKNYDQRPNTLKFTYRKNEYSIEYKKIIFIEKEPNCKRCIIKTETNKYYLTGFLKDIEKQLDDRFIKCSKSHIINIEQVKLYNKKENLIEFKNGINFFEISRNCRKKIINRLQGKTEKSRNLSK